MWKQLQSKFLRSTVPVISIHGAITATMTQRVLQRLQNINSATALALAVSIDSRGGLPVQSEIIGTKIHSFARSNNLSVLTFAGDYAVSGGYFILCMGDQVHADRVSLIGNIGVIAGKPNLRGLKRLGIDSYSISSNDLTIADIFNPFTDIQPQHRQLLQQQLKESHLRFVEHVKKYRGDKIREEDQADIFSAQVFSGEQSVGNGLVDRVGTMVDILAEKYPEASLQLERERTPLRRLLNPL